MKIKLYLDFNDHFPYMFSIMKLNSSEEKSKPFQLVKYFTFTSLIVIFIGALVLSFLNTHLARTMQQKKSEDYAQLLVENLNHQVFLQFIIPIALKYGKIQLREKEQFERMDKVVRSTLHSFKVEMVNIYDIDNTISYSFDPSVIGKKDSGGKGYRDAVAGKSMSKLLRRGNWIELLFGFPKDSKLITFAPLRAEKPLSRISGPVLGVVEIVQDLSEDYKAIFDFQIRVVITCAVVMGVLFLVLLFVVKRGEGIIEKRALERLRLKEQLSRAERLSSLGEMVAVISHEIRNPLGIIRSSSELLEKKMAQFDPTNTVPSIIVEESARLNSIITGFLDFAKPKQLHMTSFRIEEILEKNINFLGSKIDNEGYIINTQFNSDLPEITADHDMLYQAFLNILINAMQAMPDGGKIHVETSLNNNTVIILFEDEGTGIPEDLLGKIWDPFFTTKEKGTGLGLGVVKNIVESHGGNIKISNRPLRGACVFIEMPIEQGE
jgi:signal transduction histidine kinase